MLNAALTENAICQQKMSSIVDQRCQHPPPLPIIICDDDGQSIFYFFSVLLLLT